LATGDYFSCLCHHAPIDVAERNNFDWGDLNKSHQITFSVPSAADQPNAERFFVGEFSAPAERRSTDCRARS
jgi:hypothetical protein